MRTLRTNRLVMLVALAVAISVLAVACGGGKETDPVKLVPEGSTLIAQANLGAILASEGSASIFDALPLDEDGPQTLDELLDEAIEETGVDLRQLSQLAIFTDLSRVEEFSGVVVRGTFDEDSLISAIRNSTGSILITTDYKGRVLYTPEDDSDSFTLAVLEEETLVLGTREAVQAVIDVQDGDREPLSGAILDRFNDLGLGLFRLELDLSTSDFVQRLPALGEIPFLDEGIESLPGVQDALQDLQLVGLSLSQNGQILILRTNLDFASTDSATEIGDFLDGVLKLAAGLIPDQETQDLVKKIELDTDESRVTLRLEMTAAEVGPLVTGIFGASSSETAVQEAEITRPRIVGSGDELGAEISIMPTRNHVAEGQTVDYRTTPPTSGDHWARWAECGFYEDGLPDERITHNLEHGNIVVSYNFSNQQQIDELRAAMDSIDLAAEWGVTRFYDKIPEIPEGLVMVAAWGRMDRMPGIDRDRIAAFFDAFAGKLGPERIAC
jgi:hypothetical protein